MCVCVVSSAQRERRAVCGGAHLPAGVRVPQAALARRRRGAARAAGGAAALAPAPAPARGGAVRARRRAAAHAFRRRRQLRARRAMTTPALTVGYACRVTVSIRRAFQFMPKIFIKEVPRARTRPGTHPRTRPTSLLVCVGDVSFV